MNSPITTLTRAYSGADKSGPTWGLAALTASLVSFASLIAVRVGDAANWPGFSEGDPDSTLTYVLWECFVYGVLVAPLLGVLAVWRGTRRNRPIDVRLGVIAIAWFLFALLTLAADS